MTNSDVIKYISESNDINFLVSILELSSNCINIDTISGMAKKEKKTPRGIRISKQYRKVNIGRAKLAVKGLEESELPF